MFDSLVKFDGETPAPKETDKHAPSYPEQLAWNQVTLSKLLPIVQIELAQDELEKVQTFQMASIILGPAASAPMVCSEDCPVRLTCPLAQVGKEPLGEKCPFEQQYITERFLGWLSEIGRTLEDVLESERSAIATLATLDLQERRCNAILSYAENAALTDKSVRDVDMEGKPVAWETVIHLNAERLNQIVLQRRMLLRDLELTPEMKTKRLKALASLGKGSGNDFSSKQSENADKIKRAMRGEPTTINL